MLSYLFLFIKNHAAAITAGAAVVSVVIAVLALGLSGLIFWRTRTTRRQKLIHTVRYHIKFTLESLEGLEDGINGLAKKIQHNRNYTPYFVISREDNLTYTDLIELMRWLKKEKHEETLLRYFHAQADLHAAAASFSAEVAHNLPVEQKIKLAKMLVRFRNKTRKYAQKLLDDEPIFSEKEKKRQA